MKFETLRTEIKPTESSSFIAGDDVCSFVDNSWYLNEEKVYVDGFDDAVAAINEKIKNYKEKISGLVEDNYSIEQVFKIVKKYNTKVSQTVLENCIAAASSKQLTNDRIVLELRKQDNNLANDKYLFVLENNEVVALNDTDMLMLEKFDEELLAYGKQSADNLKQIFRGIY